MRAVTAAGLGALLLISCRTYDNYAPLANQSGLLPATKFARFGREQAELVAIGRSLAAWRMTEDPDALVEQASRAACFARRLPDVVNVNPDPLGFRLTVQFKSGWRVAAIPIDDGVEPTATPGLPTSLPPPGNCS